jgi:simple sugar transport system ATP-binding protein
VESGTISVRGVEVQNTSIKNVLDHSVATIPSDRHRWGLVLPFTVAENVVLEIHDQDEFGSGIRLDYDRMRAYTRELIREFDIRPDDCEDHAAGGLSGGNQQKVIIAREVSREPDLLVAVQPTRGLDVGAIEFVHKALVRERDRGAAILLISLELDEVMSVSDRIDVIYDGAIVGSFDQGTVNERQIGLLMAGGESK